jgi:DNA-binding transcriptional regulator GbsR (MarR family)
MNAAQKRFVDGMGQQMVSWGLARTTGRIYAYLLLQPEPVSLDEIATDLHVAKSGASVSTRHLIGFGLARGSGELGTRRLRYAANHDLDSVLAARTKQLRDFTARLQEGAAAATATEPKRQMRHMTAALEVAMAEIARAARHGESVAHRGEKGKRS